VGRRVGQEARRRIAARSSKDPCRALASAAMPEELKTREVLFFVCVCETQNRAIAVYELSTLLVADRRGSAGRSSRAIARRRGSSAGGRNLLGVACPWSMQRSPKRLPPRNAPASVYARTPYATSATPRGRAAEALAGFPPAWVGRVRGTSSTCRRSPLDEGSLPEPPLNALVWLRRNALRKENAASRACRPKRSRNFRRQLIERVRGRFWLS